MAPDARFHNPNPAFIRELVDAAGLGVAPTARRLGIGRATLFRYFDEPLCPYPVQYALERLVQERASVT